MFSSSPSKLDISEAARLEAGGAQKEVWDGEVMWHRCEHLDSAGRGAYAYDIKHQSILHARLPGAATCATPSAMRQVPTTPATCGQDQLLLLGTRHVLPCRVHHAPWEVLGHCGQESGTSSTDDRERGVGRVPQACGWR